jgi:hypothetical protein
VTGYILLDPILSIGSLHITGLAEYRAITSAQEDMTFCMNSNPQMASTAVLSFDDEVVPTT